MTPKAIVFDLGKVLLDFDWLIAGRRIAARSRRTVDGSAFFQEQLPLILRYELGQVSTREMCEALQTAIDFLGTTEEFRSYFAEIFTEITPMIELHASFRKKGLPTYIFSNTNELAVEHIRERYPFFAGFDGYIYSFEHGAMKPDAKLYEVVERESKRRGNEILYFDDRPENVAAGLERGWQAVLHESPEKTLAAVQKLGVLNGD